MRGKCSETGWRFRAVDKIGQADRDLDRSQWIVLAAGLYLLAGLEFTLYPRFVRGRPRRVEDDRLRFAQPRRQREFRVADTDFVGLCQLAVLEDVHSILRGVDHDPRVRRNRIRFVVEFDAAGGDLCPYLGQKLVAFFLAQGLAN